MFEPSPQPEITPDLAGQIEHDLQSTIESNLKKQTQEKAREKENPKLAGKQQEETEELKHAHEYSKTAAKIESRAARQKVAPASLPESASLQEKIKNQVKEIKEKFFTKLCDMLPPFVGVFLGYLLHLNYKPAGQNKIINPLENMNISLPVIGSVDVGKYIGKAVSEVANDNNNQLPEVIKGNKLANNPQFLARVDQIVDKIGCSRAALLKIMQKESGIDPHNINKTSHATGLIQFMPNTARGMGTTVEKLAHMDGIKQLDYVEKFYAPYFGKIHSYSDLYLATFYPYALGKPANFVLGSEKSDAYAKKVAKQNPAVSKGKPYATVEDFRRYAGGEPKAAA